MAHQNRRSDAAWQMLWFAVLALALAFAAQAQTGTDAATVAPTGNVPGAVPVSPVPVGTVVPTPAATPEASAPPAVQTSVAATTSAADTAEKIVAPAGVPMKSTEASAFGTTEAQAPGPGIMLRGNQLAVGDRETSERLAVESAADLLTKLRIVVPRSRVVAGQREMDEPTTPTQFDDTEIEKLIGRNPTVAYQVIYKATPIPDPMVVPWVRNAVVLKERFDEAIQLLAENKIDQGREALLDIETQFPDSEYAAQSREIRKRLNEIATAPPTSPMAKTTPTPTPVPINIDPNVKVSTVLIDQDNPNENRVMINRRTYAVGEVVKDFPNHKIIQITDDIVTVEVEVSGHKREFTVPVRQAGAKK